MELLFGSVPALLTTVLVVAMIVFIVLVYRNREKVTKWGRLIAIFLVVGIAVSAMSGTRDNFAASGALFAMNSFQAYACMALGGAIVVTALISVFFKNQSKKSRFFAVLAVLFIAKVAIIEISRFL